MPIYDQHQRKAYVRSYHRAVARLRDAHPEEFASLLAAERGLALHEDTDINLLPGPNAGRRIIRHSSKTAEDFPAELALPLTADEAEDLLTVLTESLRARLRVAPGRMATAQEVIRRLVGLVRE